MVKGHLTGCGLHGFNSVLIQVCICRTLWYRNQSFKLRKQKLHFSTTELSEGNPLWSTTFLQRRDSEYFPGSIGICAAFFSSVEEKLLDGVANLD